MTSDWSRRTIGRLVGMTMTSSVITSYSIHYTKLYENQTLATITFQNYFRMYDKLGGMTGTADTEAAEFAEIYNLEVMVIPTNRPMVRRDQSDVIYKTEKEKFKATIEDIVGRHQNGQPTLVGTISIEKSEELSRNNFV